MPIASDHVRERSGAALLALAQSLVAATPAPPTPAPQGPALIVWEAAPPSSGINDRAMRVSPREDGGAFVLGEHGQNHFYSDLFLARYAPDGTASWIEEFGAPGVDDEPTGLCADGAGGAFVAGVLGGAGFADPPIGMLDGFLARFDATGALLWSRRIGGSADDWVRSIVADGAGGVFACGSTRSGDFGTPVGVTFEEAFVARYDASGAELWLTRIEFAGTTGSRLHDLCFEAGGSLFSVGERVNTSGSARTAAAARLDTSGGVAWTASSLMDFFTLQGVIGDGAGGIVASGNSLGLQYGAVIRVDGSGALQAQTYLPSGLVSYRYTSAWDVARLEDGSFVVAGGAHWIAPESAGRTARYLFRLDGPSLQLTWIQAFDVGAPSQSSGDFRAGVVDGRGGLWVAGFLAPQFSAPWTPLVTRLALPPLLGQPGCAGQLNSSGSSATTAIVGSGVRADDAVTVFTRGMPSHAPGYYVASLVSGFTPAAGGSQGDLCLAGAISRFDRPWEVLAAGEDGRFHLMLDLDAFPSPAGAIGVAAGQTWQFQAWYRDVNPTATSNFSSSASFTTH